MFQVNSSQDKKGKKKFKRMVVSSIMGISSLLCVQNNQHQHILIPRCFECEESVFGSLREITLDMFLFRAAVFD